MNLVQTYQNHCHVMGYQIDPDQSRAAEDLDRFAASASAGKGTKGLYFWGSVGRGKTMLMDLLYEQMPMPKKRVHFHALIRDIRDRLARESGANPMERIAAEIAPPNTFICIDELHVSDVDNTLLIEVFLTELLKNRLVIVTTSNFSPKELMPDAVGLSHAGEEIATRPGPMFIESRKQILKMIELDFEELRMGGAEDYRRTAKNGTGAYIESEQPTDEIQNLLLEFDVGYQLDGELRVFGRLVPTIGRYEDLIWLNYTDVCERPFSYRDYLEFIPYAHCVILQDVNIVTLDGAKRLGWFVEVVYDLRKQLILTSPTPIEKLFDSIEVPEHLEIEFERVISRIMELTA